MGIEFDEAWSRRVAAIYQTSDVVRQRRAVLDAVAVRPGERVLDVGSGPGFLARELGLLTGASGSVVGVDVSADMVVLSRQHCADLPWVAFDTGDATALAFADGAFDAAVSTQVYEYVPDVERALAELHRVLRPGGRALVLDTDWDSVVWNSSDPARMNRVMAAFEAHCAHPRLARALPRLLRDAGFEVAAQSVFTILNPAYDPDTYSHGIIEFVASFVSERPDVGPGVAAAWADDLRDLGSRGEYFFSLNRYLFSVTKPAHA